MADKNAIAERFRSAKAAGMSEKDAVLVSLKRDKKDKKKNSDMCSPCSSEGSDYPWGLEVRLENESLDKLGIDDLPEPETEVTITAKATVTNVSSSANSNKKTRSLTLQITSMALSEKE